MLHLGIGVGLVSTNGWSLTPGDSFTSSHADNPGEEPIPIVQLSDPPITDPRQQQQITIGDENSDADSMTWLGFDEATPHHADLGEVEQPALERDPSMGGPGVPEVPAIDPTNPSETHPQPAPQISAPPPPQEEAAPPPAPTPALEPGRTEEIKPEETKEPDPEPAENIDDPTEHVVLPQQEESNPQDIPGEDPPTPKDEHLPPPEDQSVPKDEPTPEDQPQEHPQDQPQDQSQDQPAHQNPDEVPPAPPEQNSPPVQPSAPQQAVPGGEGTAQGPGSGTSDAHGMADDRESDASSIEDFPIRELGKPLAAKGLRIITTKPRLSYHTQVFGWGLDPVVRIGFASDGRVREVEFLQESGNPDIDRPVKDALFQWRAEGKALAALGDPIKGEVISVDVRIIK